MILSAPEPLSEAHDLSSFSCGKPVLDNWLRTRALSNQQKGFTAVMVVHEAGRVVGYYGLAPTAVVPTSLPRSIRTGQAPAPCLAFCLGSWPPTMAGMAGAWGQACSSTLCKGAWQAPS